MDNELAVVVSNANQNVSFVETIDAIIKAGFKNVFIQWYDSDFVPSQEEQLKYIKEKGLNVIFAHLGYQNINDIWLDNDDETLVERYINDIKICKENNIPMVIMHLTRKSNAPMYNKQGLEKIKRIVDYAKSLDIKVAFENTKIEGYLDYVIDNIDNDNVGICFDSGHYHAHFNDKFDFDKYKNRIFAVHLHDNDKSADLHLIPFDGTLDFNYVTYELNRCNYNGPITLEIIYQSEYLNMNIYDFYQKGYEVGEELKLMFTKNK